MTSPTSSSHISTRGLLPAKSSISTQGLLDERLGVIADGHFNERSSNHRTNDTAAKDRYECFGYAVATSAFHNSTQRIDPPKCHPNTRIEVLESIMHWILQRDDRDAWIMWLHGATGIGKSAIGQSIAELCVARGISIASFFFLRTDPSRNTIRPLVATLAYQLARSIPALCDTIASAIERDPLVFDQSFAFQLERLILGPLRQIGRLSSSLTSSYSSPLLILIDGLDECDDTKAQIDLIHTLSEISANKNIGVLFLIASRPEFHLTVAFNSKTYLGAVTRLDLDKIYSSDDEIRLFLDDKFAEIRVTHVLRHLLDPAWPARSLVDVLVKKSSSQFMFAAVVVKYVALSKGHPGLSLEGCCALGTVHSDAPFAQLDVLYRHIFSQACDIDYNWPVLAFALYASTHIYPINVCLHLASGYVEKNISNLEPLIYCKEGRINFLHISLQDFFYDPRRSKECYIDPGVWCAYLGVSWLQNHTALDADLLHVAEFFKRADPTPELRRKLFKLAPKFEKCGADLTFADLFELVSVLKTLDFCDGGEIYDCIFLRTARFLKAKFPAEYYQLLQQHSPVSPSTLSKIEMQQPDLVSRIKDWVRSWTKRNKSQKGNMSKTAMLLSDLK